MKTGYGINELKERIAKLVPTEDETRRIVGDLLLPGDFVVLVVPIDKAAPKGRLILPQQQTIRDILEADAVSVTVKETQLKETLRCLGKKPKLVITDSQVFNKVSKDTPDDIMLTSFSILFARYKGNLKGAVLGARAVERLKNGDTVLILSLIHISGIPTGFTDFDAKTAGLQKSDLILLAARPSMGKTAFALNIAQNAAIRYGVPTAIFSLEMSKEQLVNRMLCSEAMIDAQRLRTGSLDDSDWPKLIQAMGPLSEADIYIDDTPGISPMEIRAKCRRLKLEKGLGLILIDYLQLMSSNGKNDSRQQEISEISRSLKAVAREMEAPVIALSQLSRACEQRADHRPMLSDLRESGAIEQDADVVAFLYRDEYYFPETDKKNQAELIIAKQRNGPTGTVELTWLGQYTKFGNALKY